jgi:uncharacterized membrane protein HdeD (DUF308 family)
MFNTPGAPQVFDTASGLQQLRAKSGWIVALGIIYVVAGFVALGSVVLATVATVFVVGVMMLIAGVAEVISAFQIKTWRKFLLWLLLGVLYIVAGFVTFENPFLAAALLTLLLGFSLVASGVMRIVLAFSMKEGAPCIWVALSGTITVLLGVVFSSTLAGIPPLHSGAVARHRSRTCGSRLDRCRLRPEGAHLTGQGRTLACAVRLSSPKIRDCHALGPSDCHCPVRGGHPVVRDTKSPDGHDVFHGIQCPCTPRDSYSSRLFPRGCDRRQPVRVFA